MTYLWNGDGMDYDSESERETPWGIVLAALLGGLAWLVGSWLLVVAVWAVAG